VCWVTCSEIKRLYIRARHLEEVIGLNGGVGKFICAFRRHIHMSRIRACHFGGGNSRQLSLKLGPMAHSLSLQFIRFILNFVLESN
jgi:hypothetical protein